MSNRHHKPIAPRRGLTLVELLVVLGILMILMGIAATAVKTGTRGKKQREAARQVNAFIAGAQARAVELNRPVGIEIVRNVRDTNSDGTIDAGLSNTSLLMYMIEAPPPYAGDVATALASVTDPLPGDGLMQVSVSPDSAAGAASLFAVGDSMLIRLNYRGPQYVATVTQLPALPSTHFQLNIAIPSTDRTNFLSMGPVPFQLYSPPQRNSVTPIQLPTDMCIDLACSGVGNTGNDFANWITSSHSSLKFTFTPQGSIHRYSTNGTAWARPAGNLHLLVGKYEYAVNMVGILGTTGIDDISLTSVDYQSFLSDPELPTNLSDGTSMWVSINYLTGQVTTSRNKLMTAPFTFTATGPPDRNHEILYEARQFARNVLTVRGQEDS